jgi:hypothetical protein
MRVRGGEKNECVRGEITHIREIHEISENIVDKNNTQKVCCQKIHPIPSLFNKSWFFLLIFLNRTYIKYLQFYRFLTIY